MDEFIKKAKEQGRIKNVEEAFKKYPVSDEIHQGDIDYFIEEKQKIYGNCNIGDIVFVNKFKYANNEKGQNHLFVIIGDDNLSVPISYFGFLLSSKLDKVKYKSNEIILKTKANGLKKDSIVKLDEIYVLKKENILFKIGEIDIDIVNKYRNKFNKGGY